MKAKVSKDTSFHEHFRIQDIKYNRRRRQGRSEKSHPPSEQIFVQSEESVAMREKM